MNKEIARPTNTIVAPDVVSRMIDPTKPSTTLRRPNIGESMLTGLRKKSTRF